VLEIPVTEARPFTEADSIGWYGIVEGLQTVPRAELAALTRFLQFILNLETVVRQTLYVFTDSMVVPGYTLGTAKAPGMAMAT